MKISQQHQTIIMMGESGTGKTYNTNQLIKFFCPSSNTNAIGNCVEAVVKILEVFGNSMGYENRNSSRISKKIKVFSIQLKH